MKVASPLVLVSALSLLGLPGAVAQSSGAYKSTLTVNCPGECTVWVTVPAGCGSGIRVSPDPIVTPKARPSRITWKVREPWEFDRSSGIFVHMGTPAFTGLERSGADGRTFTAVINHPHQATFKYDINLVGPGGACRLDPTVVNW